MGVEKRIAELTDHHAPRVLPPGWSETEAFINARTYWRKKPFPLSVILEVAEYDMVLWLHVSCSGRTRIPTWNELREVKDLFCGRDALSLQVLPPQAEYVNVDPNVLHLWTKLEGVRPVPDFRRGGII